MTPPRIPRLALAALAAVTLAWAGPAQAADPVDFRNADPSAFGSVDLPPYLDAAPDAPTPLAVRLLLHPEALAAPAARYLIVFDLPGDTVRVEDVTLTHGGKPVAIERDDSGSARQPGFVVAGDALPRDGPVELVLAGAAVADADGQAHVGVLAIAFDAGWGTVRTRDGDGAQAYAFTLLMSDGHAAPGAFAPGFQGQGNSALALLPLLLFGLLTAVGLRAAWHHLHPPPARLVGARAADRAPVRPLARAPTRAAPATPVAHPQRPVVRRAVVPMEIEEPRPLAEWGQDVQARRR